MDYLDFAETRSRSRGRVNTRKKVAKDIEKGAPQNVTAYRMQYRSHDVKRDQNWKRPDNIFFGTKFTDKTNYKEAFKNMMNDKKIKEEYLLNKDLKTKNKDANFYDNLNGGAIYPIERKANSQMRIKSPSWKKDRWYGDNTPMEKNTVYQKYFQQYQEAQRAKAKPIRPIDSIPHTHENIRPMRSTSYKRYYRENERSYDVDKGIRNLNKDFDKTTEQIKPCHTIDKVTETRQQFNITNARIDLKPHTGKDLRVRNELLQLMNNYEFADED